MPIIQNNSHSFHAWCLAFGLRFFDYKNKGGHGLEVFEEAFKQLEKIEDNVPEPFYKCGKYKIETFSINKTEVFDFQVVEMQPVNGPINDMTVMFLHGGAFIMKTSIFHWQVAQWLVDNLQCTVLVPLYPVAPKFTYKDTTPHLLKLYKQICDKSKNIFVLGDSAGGWLALYLAIQVRDAGYPQPQHTILISPWIDVSMEDKISETIIERDPLISHIRAVHCGNLWVKGENPYDFNFLKWDLSNLGKMTIFAGGLDFLTTQAYTLFEKLKDIGQEPLIFDYVNMIHAFPLFRLPESVASLNQIKSVIQGNSLQQIQQRGKSTSSIYNIFKNLRYDGYI